MEEKCPEDKHSFMKIFCTTVLKAGCDRILPHVFLIFLRVNKRLLFVNEEKKRVKKVVQLGKVSVVVRVQPMQTLL